MLKSLAVSFCFDVVIGTQPLSQVSLVPNTDYCSDL